MTEPPAGSPGSSAGDVGAALRASEERFRLASEALAGFVYDWDPATNRVQHFGSTDSVVGFRPDEVPPDPAWWRSRVHPDDLSDAARIARAALDGDAAGYVVEYRVRHRDGRYRDVLDRARIVRDASGVPIRVVGGASDISEHRRSERERAARLEQECEARLRAESANRAKAELLAMMGHELRTPLNAILGYARLLEQGVYGPVTAAQRDVLARIARAQQHLLALIDDLMRLATLEAGPSTLEITDVPLAELCDRLEAIVWPQVAARHIAYACRLGGPVPGAGLVARADRERLLQILVNLVSNAIKYTPDGGAVAVDAGADAEHVYVWVGDTGCGIPADALETIFHPFVRLDQTRADREGTGLGLAISRELARAMGGDIVAESVVGVGSTFTLVLPHARAAR